MKSKPSYNLKLDTRKSFVANVNSTVWGIKLGVSYSKRIKFGIGYNYLKTPIISRYLLENDKGNYTVASRLRMRYVSFYTEYVYYKKNKWRLSIPVQLGTGYTNYVSFINPSAYNESPKRFVLLYEPCLSVNYQLIPYVTVGAEIGLRLALRKHPEIREQLTAPIYVFRLIIDWSEIVRDVFPNNKITKKLNGKLN